jgi:hypothetical protein
MGVVKQEIVHLFWGAKVTDSDTMDGVYGVTVPLDLFYLGVVRF